MGLGLTLPTLAEERAKSRSFKGWELYSWLNGQDWSYALLPGTNHFHPIGKRLKLSARAVNFSSSSKDAPNKKRPHSRGSASLKINFTDLLSWNPTVLIGQRVDEGGEQLHGVLEIVKRDHFAGVVHVA